MTDYVFELQEMLIVALLTVKIIKLNRYSSVLIKTLAVTYILTVFKFLLCLLPVFTWNLRGNDIISGNLGSISRALQTSEDRKVFQS